MHPVVLTLAAFTGFPASAAPPGALLPATAPVAWGDTLIVLTDPPVPAALEPEASAADEVLDDAPEEPPHVVLVGCDLMLPGGLDPESWSRELWLGAPLPRIVENGHLDKEGRWIDYEQIARRPERPEWYGAYRYGLAGGTVVSGYDLDKPDDEQRRGHMNAVGHGGVDLVAELGAPIKALRLEQQVGDAEVLYVGPLYGETVVTRQAIREGGAVHDYLVIYGHLDRAGDEVRRGRHLREGAVVGYVGNSDSPSLVHLHLETRRVRDGVDAWKLPGDALHAREFSVVGDPRNVLPLAAPTLRTPRCAPKLAPPVRRYWLGEQMALTLE